MHDLKEDPEMRRRIEFAIALLVALIVLGAPHTRAQDDDDDDEDQAAVIKALPQAKVSLDQAMLASEHDGTAISAKFEVEDGKLQLSVYTVKADKFSEVIVDYVSGKVSKVEAITSGEDLAEARAQSVAMAKAKKSLRAAVEETLKANKGYQAFSVVPSLKDGHPAAEVSLAKGEETKTVQVKLE
jgi:hypothetical protein